MSRIHEALKRAEQEKLASNAFQPVEEAGARVVAMPELEPELPIPSVTTRVASPEPPAETKSKALQFDDLSAKCPKPRWNPDASMLVFSSANPFTAGTEQFRTLRSRLYKIRDSQPLQTILITSAIPAEGKTVVSSNLAHALVRQKGCRVLLIDSDLRSPRVHTLLGAPATPGLADYLQGGASEFEIIQQGHEEGLCFIPAGNHVTHPSELISSARMKQFLDLVRPAFDWIIIDSPPVLPVADASVLSRLSDGLLFVVRAGSTPSEPVRKACRELKDSRIIGVVLNNVEGTAESGVYYGYNAYGLKQAQ